MLKNHVFYRIFAYFRDRVCEKYLTKFYYYGIIL